MTNKLSDNTLRMLIFNLDQLFSSIDKLSNDKELMVDIRGARLIHDVLEWKDLSKSFCEGVKKEIGIPR